jgi:hypothetical protein
MLGTYNENMAQFDHSKVHNESLIMIFERIISHKS